ncbi:hypothetical protein CB0940_11074 [Cercospora beticola]|uniref:Putative peptidase domain-containing protein n=1 Tax=Cercospora beticola TaxID=122368 RepID=A0A2G5HFB8_CERBT|nr:hypothetical protein CB0940_11074 [Cercospora beticola]PIA90932.1 hypothetical protein CB0940_11074 [Cercospora beticola]WPB07903.1 hypothetical protein RHO25_012567 [Cercospora beticola]
MAVRSYQSDGSVHIAERDIDNIQDAAPEDMLQEIDDILGDIHTKSKRGTIVKRLASQYLPDFDMNNPTDSGHVQQLKDGQTDAVQLASYLEQSWSNAVDNGIYGHYFGDADKDAVQKVYKNIWGTDDQEGSIDLGYIFWTNKDIKGICTTPGTEKVGDSITLAYIGNLVRNNQQIAIAHMCDQGYDVPKRSDVSCDSLGSTVSTLMDVLGAIILHEYTHFDRIGKAATGTHIGDKAYGPLDVKGLSDADKLINADSYRWLALEYYWTTVCGKTFSGPRDDRDNDESACQPGKCIVQ